MAMLRHVDDGRVIERWQFDDLAQARGAAFGDDGENGLTSLRERPGAGINVGNGDKGALSAGARRFTALGSRTLEAMRRVRENDPQPPVVKS